MQYRIAQDLNKDKTGETLPACKIITMSDVKSRVDRL